MSEIDKELSEEVKNSEAFNLIIDTMLRIDRLEKALLEADKGLESFYSINCTMPTKCAHIDIIKNTRKKIQETINEIKKKRGEE